MMSRARWVALLLVPVLPILGLLAFGSTEVAETPATEPVAEVQPELPPPPAVVVVPDALREPSLALPGEVRDALRRRAWGVAADRLLKIGPDAFAGGARGDWAFVTGWSLVRAEREEEAAVLLPLLAGAATVPPAYDALLRGEVLLATGEPLEALEALHEVPADHPLHGRAAVLRAETLRELGRTKEAFELYEALAARPDPARGNPEALLALGLRHGPGSEKSAASLRRLWTEYPRSEAAAAGAAALSGRPTWQEVARRAEHLMEAGLYASALAQTRHVTPTGTSVDACRFAYVRGRSFYRTNQLSSAIAAFGDPDCTGEYGAKILYLTAMAQYRKGQYTTAAATFERIADRHPEETLADDGLLHAGIALQEAGDLDGAQERWARALRSFPSGDMVPEATWRAAFARYLEGRPDEAREIARALGTLPVHLDPVHVAAGRYWHARWALYPDADDPRRPHEAGREIAVEGWRALCDDQPHSYYAILAYGRLLEEAPEVAAGLARPPGAATGPWVVRAEWWERPEVQGAVAMARLGLLHEALAWWEEVDAETVTAEEMALWTELRSGTGDWLFAHAAMREYLERHPGVSDPRVLGVAYPDRYWEEVKAAAAGDRFEPRFLHALIREESNFNRRITSHAGARGLSQLMPATAREVAGWLGRPVGDLEDPATNLALGARYMDALFKQLDGNPFLALAAYNAGAGRVKQWHGEWGDVPTDEFVERIPYKETREYVKRVSGTWQTMRWEFDGGPPFPDVAPFNHHALPVPVR